MSKRKIVLRILVSPIILALLIVTYLFHAVRRWTFFLRYGGELINYDKNENVTIEMIYKAMPKQDDKMVEERLRDEKAFTDWCINHVEIESREEKYIIDNETTIYSFSDLMDYWNRYLKQRQPWMTTA